jgi:tetratricopeptide (TPR) repeat protein
MPQKAYLWILRVGVYLSLFTVFLVFKSLLFPFISSKQISFNILIEILLIFWAGLMIQYPEYRPKKSYVSFGLIAFFGILIISSIAGVDFNLSFWGDVERMLGVFHLLHFLAFYFIIITVFKSWSHWKPLLILSLVLAFIVSIIGTKEGAEVYSTIGNSAYVSAYIIFNIYFMLLLFFKEKNKWLGLLYFLPLPFYLNIFLKGDISGAVVGLGASLVLMGFLYGVLAKNKKIKIATIGITIFVVAFVGFFFANKEASWIQNNRSNPLVGILLSVDIQKNTFQTRLISWRAAWYDFKEHPTLGTGHGNYAIVFDKYFDPEFLNHTRQETYFDRAHNNLIDIASTSGLLGLISYLSIFAALAYYLVSGYRKDKISLHEFVIISSLISAYFIQNLAVFDSLVTYICLMITLGYVHWAYRRDEDFYHPHDKKFENKEIYALSGIGILLLVILYQYNYKPLQMLALTIEGHKVFQQKQLENSFKVFKQAHSYNTALDRDSRTSMVRLFLNNPPELQNMEADKRQEMLDYNIEAAKKNVDYNPEDSMNQMVLSQILNLTASYHRDNQDKFAFYSDQALEAIDKSIAASPGRVPVYYQKAQVQIARGDKDGAIETLKYAISLNESYNESYCHLAKTYSFYGSADESWEYYDQCIDLNGVNNITPHAFLKNSVVPHYKEKNDVERLIKLYIGLSRLDKKDYESWIELAKLYKQKGEIDKALEAVDKAVEINPSITESAGKFKIELSK